LGGTGLGLAITQWIINAHSGKMSVKSIEGSGTDFSVVLPKKPG
jgi:signal transduction histidine kinase